MASRNMIKVNLECNSLTEAKEFLLLIMAYVEPANIE